MPTRTDPLTASHRLREATQLLDHCFVGLTRVRAELEEVVPEPAEREALMDALNHVATLAEILRAAAQREGAPE